jgi:hypothetical protein
VKYMTAYLPIDEIIDKKYKGEDKIYLLFSI